MKHSRGFSSFEFYIVMAVIGLIALLGMQRYLRLAEETQRLSFEVLAQNFSTSVYNLHAYWTLEKSLTGRVDTALVQGMTVYFSEAGWPMSALPVKAPTPLDQSSRQVEGAVVTLESCRSLWFALLQDAEALSLAGGEAYGARKYHLSLTPDRQCRFESIQKASENYYFDYSPVTGRVTTNLSPMTKKS
jgi:hypothetical protein